MASPLTEYVLRDGIHIGYQIWESPAGGGVDVLEFSSGLMISIDETTDEPNWLRYTEQLAEFSRFDPLRLRWPRAVRPAAGGDGPLRRGLGRDALAVMDAAGRHRAVLLASGGGAMAAIWVAATHPERVASLVIVNGTARVGRCRGLRRRSARGRGGRRRQHRGAR